MKKRDLKSLRLNKKSIVNFTVVGGRAPDNGGGDAPAGPSDEPHQWFTDAAQRACETFDGTVSNKKRAIKQISVRFFHFVS
jgi:hypothetical protein